MMDIRVKYKSLIQKFKRKAKRKASVQTIQPEIELPDILVLKPSQDEVSLESKNSSDEDSSNKTFSIDNKDEKVSGDFQLDVVTKLDNEDSNQPETSRAFQLDETEAEDDHVKSSIPLIGIDVLNLPDLFEQDKSPKFKSKQDFEDSVHSSNSFKTSKLDNFSDFASFSFNDTLNSVQLQKATTKSTYFRDLEDDYLEKRLSERTVYSKLKKSSVKPEQYNLAKVELLHQGSVAANFQHMDESTKTNYCVKVVPKSELKTKLHKYLFEKERDYYLNLEHPNLVTCYGSYQDSEFHYLLLEFCDGYSLQEVLKFRARMAEFEVRYLIKQIVEGLSYLHSNGLIFRDLNPNNVLITKRMQVKLTDYEFIGEVNEDSEDRTEDLGTFQHFPPELLLRNPASFLSDSWSLGVLIYRLIFGEAPFIPKYAPDPPANDDELSKVVDNIVAVNYTFPQYPVVSEAAKDLIKSLLQYHPHARLPVNEVLQHKFFDGFTPDRLPFASCMYFRSEKNLQLQDYLKERVKSIVNEDEQDKVLDLSFNDDFKFEVPDDSELKKHNRDEDELDFSLPSYLEATPNSPDVPAALNSPKSKRFRS